MKITEGRIVHYRLTEEDAVKVNQRRCAKPHEAGWPAGAQAHIGNHAKAGEIAPMLVVRAWPESDLHGVNGQVFLDGNDVLWVTSVVEGTENGMWSWPPKVA